MSTFHCLQVSVLMGYNGLHDLFENERPDEQPDRNIEDATDDFDLSLACKRFPSITLDSSLPVELYDEATSSSRIRALLAAQRFLFNSMDEKWVDPNGLSETWHSLYEPLSEAGSSVVVQESTGSHQSSWSTTLESEGKSDHPLTVEENTEKLDQSSQSITLEFEGKSDHLVAKEVSSSEVGVQRHSDIATIDLFLDRSISCIPGLSKRQSHQLEECGFYTVGSFEIMSKSLLMEVLVFIQAVFHPIYLFILLHAVAETVASFSPDLCRFTECTN